MLGEVVEVSRPVFWTPAALEKSPGWVSKNAWPRNPLVLNPRAWFSSMVQWLNTIPGLRGGK